MVEHWDHRGQPAGDPAAELEALQHTRDELWLALRNEDDPEARMPLLSKLSENRAAILRLGERLGLEHPQWAAMQNGRVYVEQAPRPDEPAADHGATYFAYRAPPGAGPAARPVRRPRPESRPRPPGEPAAVARPVAAVPLPSKRPALVALGGLAVVLGVTWLVLSRPFGDGTQSAAPSDVTVEAVEAVAPAGPDADGRVGEIAAVLRGLGLSAVEIERYDSVIHLSGTVTSEAERGAALGAAQALSGGDEVDASQLVVQPGEGAGLADAATRAAALQVEIDRITAVTPLIFREGAVELTELHLRILNNVATIMVAYPGTPVRIVGTTDGAGSDDANRDLSSTRAGSVRDYLVSQGVPEPQLEVEARGEDTSSGSIELANLERRVEFEVLVPAGSVALPPSQTTLRVAIVAPSARNDLAFTQSMVDAVNMVAAERGNVEVAVTDNTVVPDDAAAAIRDYAAQGYGLVIAHGSQFGSSLIEIAPEFPDVVFAWGTASDTFDLPNVYAYEAAAEQGGYVQGALSSLLSGSGTVGVVGPIEVGDAERYVNGFRAGAEAESSATQVLVAYTGSFSDLTLAAETAQAHLAAGADVMTGSAQMVVGAVSVASESGVRWFGTQANQATLAPDLVVASQVYHWEVILRQIVSDLDAGTPDGTYHTAELANGGLVIEFNPQFQLPDEARRRADEIIAGIASGAIRVPA